MRFVRTAENLFGLPLGFTRVETIESTGTQYIDTGVYGNLNTKIEAKVYSQKRSSSNSGYCIAGDFTTSTKAITMPFNFTSGGLYSRFGDKAITSGIQQLNGTYIFAIDKEGYYVDGVKIANLNTTTSFTTDGTIMLFGFTGLGRNYLVGKMYYCKIWDGDALVRDFIPCIDPLGVACMFDLVGKKPYYNQGTGTFTVGRQVIPVEYLESTGTQYIDTLTTLSSTDKVKTKCRIVSTDAVARYVFGVFGNSKNFGFNLGSVNVFNGVWGSSNAGAGTGTAGADYTIELSSNGLYVNGTLQHTVSGTFTGTANAYLFLANGTTQPKKAARIYYLQIYHSDTLVRDYIPAIDENGVGFMFDKVSGTVYLNAGTGAFSVGEPVYTSKLRLIRDTDGKVRFIQDVLPREYRPLKYLESTGTQYIDTGIIPTSTTETKMGVEILSIPSTFACFGGTNILNDVQATYAILRKEVNASNFSFRTNYNNAIYYSLDTNKKYDIIMNEYGSRNLIVNSDLIGTFTGTVSANIPIYLFARNSGGTAETQYSLNTRLYYFSIKDSTGKLVRDFIPVLRILDNKPGMYDKITKQFFVNQGTGEFSYE